MRFSLSFFLAIFASAFAFAEPVEITVLATGNGLVRVNGSEFATELKVSQEPGSTIQVEINSLDNFIGWGGWGKNADRSIEKSKTITVGSSPMTITAYFTSSIKDNLILNGDFSLVSNLSSTKTTAEEKATTTSVNVLESFDRLTAGKWDLVNQDSWDNNKYARTGLLLRDPTDTSNLNWYSEGSMTFVLGGKYGTSRSKNSKVKCSVNVSRGGVYKLTFVRQIGRHYTYMYKNTWDVKIYLVDGNGKRCFEKTITYEANDKPKYASYAIEDDIPRKGIYELYFELERPTITQGSGSYKFAHVAYDNLSLNLVRTKGFSIAIR